MQQQQQQIVTTTVGSPPNVVTVPAEGRVITSYQATSSIVLGSLQLSVGILAIILNAAGIGIEAGLSHHGHGFWCGIFFIVAGILGILAGKQKTSCMIVGHMVMSIFSAIMCIFLLSFAASGVTEDKNHFCYFGFCVQVTYATNNEGKLAVNGILVGLALFETIVAIWASAICCGAVCCGSSPSSHRGTIQTIQYTTSSAVVHPQVTMIGGTLPVQHIQPQNMMIQPPTYTITQGPAQVHMPVPVGGPQPPAYSPPVFNQPQASGGYTQPGGGYPQPGGSYPHPGGSYPQPGGSYPQPGGSHPQQAQQLPNKSQMN